MIKIIILIGFVLLPCISIIARLILLNPISCFSFGIKDFLRYFSRRLWTAAPYGTIKMYIAANSLAFGCGKTLSATREIVRNFHRYDGVKVWDRDQRKYLTQRVIVLSNVDFNSIPYIKLISLAQFVQMTDEIIEYDRIHDSFTVFYLFIDEASSQLNSRSFKSNFDAPFISRLLTSRHVHANLILTSQRSGMVDKLMRDCCNVYITCKKIWRFEILKYFDAYKVEVSQDITSVRALRRTGFFIKDSLFRNYDTFANVKALQKSCQEGDMLSDEEILSLRVDNPVMMGFSKKEMKKIYKRRQIK